MRIQGENGIFNYNNIAEAGKGDSAGKSNSAGKSGVDEAGNGLVMKAGDLNLGTESIEEKRKKAQQMALGIVSEAFESDKEIDNDLNERRQRIKDLQADNAEYTKELKRIEEFRADVIENYSVTEDSKEHADLELLRKEMLDLDERQKYFQGKIDENMKVIKEENSIITGIRLERLKSHEMVDAQKQGDKIMDAASDAIIGELIADAKEKLDEKVEENQENAEAVEKKAEEMQEKLDEARAERKAREEQLEEMYRLESELDEVSVAKQMDNIPDVKKSLESVVNELKLTMQDLAGAVVDDIV